jgi:hypothetical protein
VVATNLTPASVRQESVFITEIFPVCFHLPHFEGLQIPIQAQVRQPDDAGIIAERCGCNFKFSPKGSFAAALLLTNCSRLSHVFGR